jgi:hypothetical protein
LDVLAQHLAHVTGAAHRPQLGDASVHPPGQIGGQRDRNRRDAANRFVSWFRHEGILNRVAQSGNRNLTLYEGTTTLHST